MPVSTQGSLLGGRYRVVRHLGSGGMASVLLCHDERLGREVAVKRLHSDSPSDAEQRFAREAKVGASLNHPNLVSVFDTATDDEGVLIVMEYVEGEALSRALKRGPLGWQRVGALARDLGSALDHAHAAGVVHRDVKPSNVLLRKDGTTKLVDLGIATAVDQTRITRSGTVLGTAAYMAPEQLEGGDIGPYTDVYGLAAVCYEALAGQPARTGRTPVEVAHRIATEDPPDIREVLPKTPFAAAQALMRGMARDAADRPRSAGELALELTRSLDTLAAARARAALATARAASAAADRPARPTEALSGAATRAPSKATSAWKPRSASPPPAGPAAHAAPLPGPAKPSGGSRRSRRPAAAVVVALLLVALAAAAVIATALSSDDGGEGGRQAAGGQSGQADTGAKKTEENAAPKAEKKRKEEQPSAAAPAPEPEPETTTPAPADQTTSVDPARGAQLNDQGFRLIQQGNYAGAVPILQQAVASWPEDSSEITYAYALFNLGQALNRSGNPSAAIPYLEKRLTWEDQRTKVQAELDDARRRAGQG